MALPTKRNLGSLRQELRDRLGYASAGSQAGPGGHAGNRPRQGCGYSGKRVITNGVVSTASIFSARLKARRETLNLVIQVQVLGAGPVSINKSTFVKNCRAE